MKKLCTIDANTLQSVDYEPISFLVEDLLPPGLHLLASGWPRGSPSGTSLPARVKFSTSAWRTASNVFKAGSLISPRMRHRRCTLL